jgi:hypothetical protein
MFSSAMAGVTALAGFVRIVALGVPKMGAAIPRGVARGVLVVLRVLFCVGGAKKLGWLRIREPLRGGGRVSSSSLFRRRGRELVDIFVRFFFNLK